MSDIEKTGQDVAAPLIRVTMILCGDCISGIGGECHTPGCALWMNRAPDIPIADRCESFSLIEDGNRG